MSYERPVPFEGNKAPEEAGQQLRARHSPLDLTKFRTVAVMVLSLAAPFFAQSTAKSYQALDQISVLEAQLNRDSKTAARAANALAKLRGSALAAVPNIINTGRRAKADSDLLRECVYAIGLIAESAAKDFNPADAKDFLAILDQTLGSPVQKIREVSAYAVGRLAPVLARTSSTEVQQTITILLSSAADPDPKVQRAAVEALGLLYDNHALSGSTSDAVDTIGEALLHAIRDHGENFRDVRTSACQALKRFGPTAARAMPDLQVALRDRNDPVVQQSAADALGHIGEAARSAAEDLRRALTDGSSDVQHAAAAALGSIHPDAVKTVPVLIRALRDGNEEVREAARLALDNFVHDHAAFPTLIEAVGDSDPSVSATAARALGTLADNTERNEPVAFSYLPQAEDALQNASKQVNQGSAASSDIAAALGKIQRIKSERRAQFWSGLWRAHKLTGRLLLVLAAYAIAVLIVRFLIMPKWPLKLLMWNEALGSSTSEWPGKIQVPLKYLIPVGFFHYSPRVLDAWVSERLQAAEARFRNKETVRIRRTYVPLPVMVGEEADPTPAMTTDTLRNVCAADRWCIRIVGEGGAGKTTLACQVALWAMNEDRTKTLCESRRMIPILIEPGIGSQVLREELTLREAILLEIQELGGAHNSPQEGFLDRLMKSGRILLILDGVTEMDESIAGERWRTLELMVSKLGVSGLVVTCRPSAAFASAAGTDIHPLRIDRNHLIPFINAYLSQARVVLSDPDVYSACTRLALLVGEGRGITPLLARLYAQALIGFCRTHRPLSELPRTVPDLMLAYLNELNRMPAENRVDDAVIHEVAKCVAWECMMPSLRPGRANKGKLVGLLEARSMKRETLDVLEQKLHVIETVPPAKTEIQFTLDPIAEYLAALRVVDVYGSGEREWEEFMCILQNVPAASQEFLIALSDCIQARAEVKVPSTVIDEIAVRLSNRPISVAAGASG